MGYIKGNSIIGAALSFRDSVSVTAGTIELKKIAVHQKDFKSKEVTQTIANMLRLGGYLAKKALQKGDLIEGINIYGLLVSHFNPLCIPFKYTSECSSSTTVIMKGDEVLLEYTLNKLFNCI